MDIFNAICIFVKEPIREQEIKLECMNSKMIMEALGHIDAIFSYFDIKPGLGTPVMHMLKI